MASGLSGLRRHLHPQEEWEWPIAVYLYLAGFGAGAVAAGLLVDWILRPDLPTRAILLWGPVFVAVGAPFLILDLGRKMRFLNASLNPRTSWAGRGFIILSTLILTGLAVFLASLLPSVLPLMGIASPAWLDSERAWFRLLEIVVFVFAIGTAAYTGVFLKSTRYVGLWNTWVLPALFLVSALSTGAMGVVVALLGYGLVAHSSVAADLSHRLMPAEQLLVLLEAAVLVLFMVGRYRATEAAVASARLLLGGKLRLVFWGGIVALGLLLPVTLENVYSNLAEYSPLLFVAGGSLLTGGYFLRYGVVKGGIKERHPLQQMASMEYDWKTPAPPSPEPGGREIPAGQVGRG